MKAARLVILGTAALAGIGAFAMIVSGSKPPQTIRVAMPAPVTPTDEVLVADRDIAFGNVVDASDLRWQPWPKNSVPQGVILRTAAPNAIADFTGALARANFGPGEPVYKDRLIQAGKAGFMSAILPAGSRAVAININSQGATTAGNFILPNDHVDVIHTFHDDDAARSGNGGMVSETILHNVRVLAIGQNIQQEGKEHVVSGSSATLELTPSQVEEIVLAQKVGQLSLSLRSMADSNTAASESPAKTGDLTIVRFGVSVPARAR